ncbi:immunity 22 family protein [Paenibacillus sp. UNC451MF]|uniref:immunity 22 family protein n=1 Tax=Paenibacillus sp. UNC451MF TaxID=1449063 RepID=UPI00048ED653|nr:immunity 22 family protein [Paenibacillus sp. UNC451MF]
MKHIVTIWGANFSSEEELEAFVETDYDDDGDALPSAFLAGIGCSWIDEDFQELHYFNNEDERKAFIEYLRLEYSPHEPFAEQLPAKIAETIQAYNSIILLYGNNSPYGAINDELFQIVEAGLPTGSLVVLLTSVGYESR